MLFPVIVDNMISDIYGHDTALNEGEINNRIIDNAFIYIC